MGNLKQYITPLKQATFLHQTPRKRETELKFMVGKPCILYCVGGWGGVGVEGGVGGCIQTYPGKKRKITQLLPSEPFDVLA